jgi:hypothetical protein
MRSRLTWSNPASRASTAAAGARPAVCRRSSTASTPGAADCMPSEIRVKPALRSAASDAGVTDSGLASVVTSAPAARPHVASIPSRIRARSSGASRVGVPPPTKTVSTRGGGASPRTLAATASSASTVSAYRWGVTPPPSSVAV